MSLVINCGLCGEKSLHINQIEGTNSDVRQCINCGYSTNTNLKGTMEENETFKGFSDFIKKFSKEEGDHIWYPSMITLPFGSLYPIEKENKLKWAIVKMIDIPEKKQKNYPDESNPGKFLTKTLDFENQEVFDEYIFALSKFRDEVKKING